jgi:hypothetical protein
MHTPAAEQEPHPGSYRIRLDGHLAPRWASWFDGMTLTDGTDGNTVLEGPVVDQSALHGVLNKLRDIGLPLISVTPLDHDSPAASPEGE